MSCEPYFSASCQEGKHRCADFGWDRVNFLHSSWYGAMFWIWNTVSNLIFILPPIYGAIQTYKDGLEKRYLAAYLCLTGMCKT
uniref:Uncharacterized protein n=1 Tax=Buteo japonicus TaxID=224669 RepID=A0A8C0BIH1_9AVES